MNEEQGMENGNGDMETQEQGHPEVVPAFSSLDEERTPFQLPIGSFDLAGSYFRTVELGELGGKVRRKLGKPDILAHPGKLTTVALSEVLDFPHFSWTDREKEKKVNVRSMYSGDRAACVLRIRELTKGKDSEIVQRAECPFCGKRIDIYTSPSEITVIPIEETGFVKDDNAKDWILCVKSFGHEVRLKLSRGFEEESLSPDQVRNINDSSVSVLAACTIDFDGKPVDIDFYDKLRPRITDDIMEHFLENQPGPDMFQTVRCGECTRLFDYGVDPSDFLLPSAGRRRFARRGGRSRS